jgi:hypothetical protein
MGLTQDRMQWQAFDISNVDLSGSAITVLVNIKMYLSGDRKMGGVWLRMVTIVAAMVLTMFNLQHKCWMLTFKLSNLHEAIFLNTLIV